MRIWTIICITTISLCYGDTRKGRKKKSDRIIEGRLALVEEFPYQVSLEVIFMHMCGGSIVHQQIILSAAHCINHINGSQDIFPRDLRVRVGTSIAEQGGEIFNVKAVRVHEDYDEEAPIDTNDIGLVLLTRPIVFSNVAQPVELSLIPPKHGMVGWVTGYGSRKITQRTTAKRIHPRQLMAAELPIINTDLCRRKLMRQGAEVAKDMICAGSTKGRKDACTGDSGGPLVVDSILYGLTAWGIGCGRIGIPGVYTDLSQYKNWIKNSHHHLLQLVNENKILP